MRETSFRVYLMWGKGLTVGQLETLSDFCNDVAKGIFLATLLGQGTLGKLSGIERLVISSQWTAAALLFLMMALYFKKGIKKKK